MFRFLTRVQFAYLGILAAVCGGVFAYQAIYVWPVKACAARGGWWSDKYGECAQPIPIWQLTGRKPGQPAPTISPAKP